MRTEGCAEIMGRLPDFVIIGAQKAGTTWLGARLAEQAEIFLPRPFEVHYFDRNDNFAKGREWYAAHFAAAPPEALVGEKTPDYLWTDRPPGRGPNNIPKRMYAAVPEARLIVALRDPVARAISALNHRVRARRLSPYVNPDAAFLEAMDPARDGYGLIGRGKYLLHLKRFLEFFPRDRIHIVCFEDDIVASPQATIESMMKFLGRPSVPMKPRARPENKGMNSRFCQFLNYYLPRMSPLLSVLDRALPNAPGLVPSAAMRARLQDYYAPHNEALFQFLGRDVSQAWRGTAAARAPATPNVRSTSEQRYG